MSAVEETQWGRWLALLPQDYIDRLIAAEGKLEAGCTANAKTLRMNEPTHVRIVGESKTLCGVKLTPNYHTRWQWYGRGQFGVSLPHAMRESMTVFGYPACKNCAGHPVISLTMEAEDARRTAMDRAFEAARKKRERLDRQRDARRRRREAAAA